MARSGDAILEEQEFRKLLREYSELENYTQNG